MLLMMKMLCDYIENRSLEEMSIEESEALANAILAICTDAREAGLKPNWGSIIEKQQSTDT